MHFYIFCYTQLVIRHRHNMYIVYKSLVYILNYVNLPYRWYRYILYTKTLSKQCVMIGNKQMKNVKKKMFSNM